MKPNPGHTDALANAFERVGALTLTVQHLRVSVMVNTRSSISTAGAELPVAFLEDTSARPATAV